MHLIAFFFRRGAMAAGGGSGCVLCSLGRGLARGRKWHWLQGRNERMFRWRANKGRRLEERRVAGQDTNATSRATASRQRGAPGLARRAVRAQAGPLPSWQPLAPRNTSWPSVNYLPCPLASTRRTGNDGARTGVFRLTSTSMMAPFVSFSSYSKLVRSASPPCYSARKVDHKKILHAAVQTRNAQNVASKTKRYLWIGTTVFERGG